MILDAKFNEVNHIINGEFGVLTRGVKGDKGDKGDKGEVNIDDSATRADATWSSDSILNRLGIVCKASGNIIPIADASYLPLRALKVYGKTTQDGTPTPTTPVPLVRTGSCGRVVVGTADTNGGEVVLFSPCDVTCRANDIVTLSTVIRDESKVSGIRWYYRTTPTGSWNFVSKLNVVDTTNIIQVQIPESRNGYQFMARVSLKDGTKEDTDVATVTVGEDLVYHAPTGAVVVSTHYGVNGVPVSSGGNYTDAKGKHWLCDTADISAGVLLRKVRYCTLPDLYEDWEAVPEKSGVYRVPISVEALEGVGVLCSHLVYGNPLLDDEESQVFIMTNNLIYVDSNYLYVSCCRDEISFRDFLEASGNYGGAEVIYARKIPEVSEIPDLTGIRTYKPNTTIVNDADAYMEVEYVADTKTYIDNKIAQAIVNNV